MYAEKLLNMIDIYAVERVNANKPGWINNDTDFLNLKTIRLEVDKLLENHYRTHGFYGNNEMTREELPPLQKKDCWNPKAKGFEGGCTTILELLYLGREEKITEHHGEVWP